MTPSLDWRGRLRRITRWEYWPAWALYTPVAIRLLPELFPHLTVFTAVNPALPGGGIVGESKIEIQRQLEKACPNVTCKTLFLPVAGRERSLEASTQWMKSGNLSFPFVLKPNAAQRGLGVLFANTLAELKDHLRLIQHDYLLQPKLPGREYSLFFIQPPGEKGFIFSMTRKSSPSVVGDGSSNLVELARAHPRHRPVLHLLPELRGEKGRRVPLAGEKIVLSSIGAHCRGSTFRDARDLITPALTQKIQEIFQQMEGWNFGRFDLFSEREDDLKKGLNFSFIELNGVTSEATHIYDPRYGIFQAWSTLCQQWRWAIRIGQHHHQQGQALLSLKELLVLNRNFKNNSKGIPG